MHGLCHRLHFLVEPTCRIWMSCRGARLPNPECSIQGLFLLDIFGLSMKLPGASLHYSADFSRECCLIDLFDGFCLSGSPFSSSGSY